MNAKFKLQPSGAVQYVLPHVVARSGVHDHDAVRGRGGGVDQC